jgi:putative membrane protein
VDEPRGPHRGAGRIFQEHGHHRIGVLLLILALVAIAAVVAYLVVRMTSRRLVPLPAVGPSVSPIEDAALQQLRLRYARGEVNRTDFLQAAADLGAPMPAPPEPPPEPPTTSTL